jgi:hypothetical protein
MQSRKEFPKSNHHFFNFALFINSALDTSLQLPKHVAVQSAHKHKYNERMDHKLTHINSIVTREKKQKLQIILIKITT